MHKATKRSGRLVWSALLAVMALVLLAGCGGGSEKPAAEAAPTEAAPTVAAPVEAAPAEAAPAEAAPAEAAPSESAEGAAAAPSGTRAGDLEPSERNGMFDAPPEMVIDPSKFYYATIKTDQGDIKIQLFADRAPSTVNNFVFLAQQGFYDNTTFHRVLEDFMAQGGDPTGTGSGGPGYTFEDEFVPGLEFDRPYLLAMANAGPATNGSQFFITFVPTPHLNGLHTIFGEVIEGQETVDAITRRDPGSSTPADVIQSITIEESDTSILPTPTPLPPTPTPFPPSALDPEGRPLAAVPLAERAGYFSAAPGMMIDTANSYTATIATSKGEMTMALFDDDAPNAVNNFVQLANLGFFDGLPINQVNPTSLLVLGSPDGQADVGYRFVPEVGLPTAPVTGSVAYAPQIPTADGIEASGSMLLVALAAPPAESAVQYSFFGQVVDGLEVLSSLAMTDTIDTVTIQVVEP